MDISTLSDAELNRAMIWLNPRGVYGVHGGHRYNVHGSDIGFCTADFLRLWGLTGPIMVSRHISLVNIGGTTQWFACNDVSFETICMSPDGTDNGVSCFFARHEAYSTSPLRAICECILMIELATD